MPGWMATGEIAVAGMSGSLEFGNGRPTRELTGAIRTTTTISGAGRCMRAIGTTKTMAIITTTIIGRTSRLICDDKGSQSKRALVVSLSLYSLLLNRVRRRSNSRGIAHAQPDSPVLSRGFYASREMVLR
jgi:hypothetical protein